jgi:hypothetical protein
MIDKINALLLRKSSCVLATTDGNIPHCSLMAYIASEAADRLYLVTPKNTKKFRNIKNHPEMSLLIDTHCKSQGQVRLEMVSRFLPQGFAGTAYWYGMLPIHDWLFKGVLVQIARKFGDSATGSPHTFSVEKELECKL